MMRMAALALMLVGRVCRRCRRWATPVGGGGGGGGRGDGGGGGGVVGGGGVGRGGGAMGHT